MNEKLKFKYKSFEIDFSYFRYNFQTMKLVITGRKYQLQIFMRRNFKNICKIADRTQTNNFNFFLNLLTNEI